MPVLDVSEYDASYFDGREQSLRHNAGYSSYRRWRRKNGVNSLGEFWLDYAKSIFDENQMAGKKVLEIGCAKGFMVKDLRDLGVDAYGVDVSQYAIDNCEPEVTPYLYVGDARTELSQFSNNEFDLVYSLRFLECVSEIDIPNLISEMKRISKYQFHVVDEQPNSDFYLVHDLQWWVNSFNWAKNTQIASRETKQILKK